VAQGGVHVGVAQHARQLFRAQLARRHAYVARRDAPLCTFRHDQVVVGMDGDLREVGDHERLPAAARHRSQRLSHPPADLTPNPLIHLVEHKGGNRVVRRQNDLQRQHEAGQLAARGDSGEGAGPQPHVQLDLEDHRLGPIRPGSGEWGVGRFETPTRHSQRGKDRIDGLGQLRRACPPLLAERRAGALELRGRGGTLVADVAQVQIGRVEQLQLARRGVARRQHVGQRRAVLLLQAKQQVTPLLDAGKALGIALERRGILARRLTQLLRVGERPIEEHLPPADRGVEPLQARQDLLCPSEPRGVHRLLQLARQPAQLVGVGEAFRLGLERFVLADLGRGLLDLPRHVPQVIRLAAYLVLSGAQLRLALLEVTETLVGVPHRDALHSGIGVGVEDVALRVGTEQ